MRRLNKRRARAVTLSLLLGLSVFGLSLMLARPSVSRAATLTVTSAADSGPGTLRQAILDAASGDTINFAAGITTIDLTSDELFIDSKHLIISGSGANLLTVRRSFAPDTPFFRIFEITHASVTISGLTIANGWAPFFLGDYADRGGGIFYHRSSLTVIGCTISGNTGGEGGGISQPHGIDDSGWGNLNITNSTISGNVADSYIGDGGGGIYNPVGTLNITNSTISHNSAERGSGGGIYNLSYNYGATVTITNSTVYGNSATSGGGIYNSNSSGNPVTITNSTISDNSAFYGGGISNDGGDFGTVSITNSTISGNLAYGSGGGIDCASGMVIARNTSIALNFSAIGPDFLGTLTSQGYNLIGNIADTIITGDTTGNQLNVDPLLGPLQDNGGPTFTHSLLSGSPAIDKGHSSAFNTDQRGFTRPVDTPVITNATNGDGTDIGAYEVQADQLPGCGGNTVVTNTNDSGTGSLRGVIDNACTGQTVTFAPGVIGPITLTSGELVLNKSLTIIGPGANLLSVRRSASAGNFRILNIPFSIVNVTISGLTITNGNPQGAGGGIYNTATLTLTNITISGNSAPGDNGIGGGGGGGIYNTGALTLTNSTISDNDCSGASVGQGIGGGIYNKGTVAITNSTILGNSVSDDFIQGIGGGIFNSFDGTLTITNSTISSNAAQAFGGGIHSPTGTVSARNTIIATNTSIQAPDIGGALTSQGFNLIGNNHGATITPQPSDQIGTAASPIDPLLGPLQDNGGPTFTRALLAGSFAIDKGHSSGSATDQRGFTRPADLPNIANASGGDGGDIGAVEMQLSCSYSIDPMNAALPASGGTNSVNVFTTANCAWTAVSNSGWIVITSGANGTGNGMVGYSVAAAASQRTGTITVAGLTYTVNQAAPTAITLISFDATAYDEGVFFQWQTGLEVDNLGFNIYRDEGGARALVNTQLVAGSALRDGYGLQAGESYAWWDSSTNENSVYWLEDVDLKGGSTWHGPFACKQAGGSPPARSNAALLSKLGSNVSQGGSTNVVEAVASLAPSSSAQRDVQSSLVSQAAIKIAVKREGWYRVTQPELVAAGLNPSLEPRFLQLFVDGREIPMYVTTGKDGLFDESSAIEFYGIGLDTPSTDSRIYWLTTGGSEGKRIAQPKGIGAPSSDHSFTQTIERRDRTIYFSALLNGEKENFFGAVVAGAGVGQALTLTHLAERDTSNFETSVEVALQGVTMTAHRVLVQLNGVGVREISFYGQEQGVSKLNINQSLLREGENTVRLIPQNGASDISLVVHIRVSYQHTYTADGDSLKFAATGGQRITIDGFTSKAIRVFDITDADDVQELIGDVNQSQTGFEISAVPQERGLRTLIAVAEDRFKRAESVETNAASSLGSPANAADFVIITTDKLSPAIETLKTVRQGEGYKVAMVDVVDIYDEFNFGHKAPQAIKDFLSFAATNWKIVPRFVLFAGDASFDSRNYLGLGDSDLVPTKLVDTSYLETASDDWFADFNNDGVSDLAIGRLPLRNNQEAAAVVSKLIGYPRSMPSESVVLVSDANDGFNFGQASAQLRALIPSSFKIEEIKRGEFDPLTARTSLLDSIARGETLINYVGHGSANQWRGGLLTSADANALSNADRLPMFVMMTCLNGYFHDAALDSLAESLVKAERGGAIAAWASSGMTLPDQQAVINQQLYRLLFIPAISGKEPVAPTLGEATQRAKAAVVDVDIRRTWILLGDPTLRLRSATP